MQFLGVVWFSILFGLSVLTHVKLVLLPGAVIIGGVLHISNVFGTLNDALVQSSVHGAQALLV